MLKIYAWIVRQAENMEQNVTRHVWRNSYHKQSARP